MLHVFQRCPIVVFFLLSFHAPFFNRPFLTLTPHRALKPANSSLHIRYNTSMRRKGGIVLALLASLLLLLGQATFTRPVWAQASSPSELIQAVNALRASYGLQPYTMDGELMALAQAHSEYQASIGTLTHTRADGSGPGDLGITSENIAGGPNLSAQGAIDQWTDDYWHLNTLIGYESGGVGAGMAVKDGFVYYTLDVRNTGSLNDLAHTVTPGQAATEEGPTGQPQAAASSETVVAVQTVTPRDNGAIIHVVQPGQTLWSIALAYNTHVDSLIALNGLSATQPVIYAGQKLLVRPAYTATLSPTASETPVPPTHTPLPTNTLRPTRPTRTLAPSPTLTIRPLMQDLQQLSGRAVAMIVVLAIGLGLLLAVSLFLRK